MSAKYLLPCRCGCHVVVQARQAGQTVVCSCGASLLVPTLLEMTSLDPAPQESTPEPLRSVWSRRHRLLFLGSVLVLIALIGGVWLYLKQPVSAFDAIDPERLRQTAASLSPSQTWRQWEIMKQGLDRRTDQEYAAAMRRFLAWQVTVAAVALCGIGLIAAGVLGNRGGGRGTRGERSPI